MMQERIRNEYFEWISSIVCGERFNRSISFSKLLSRLHDTEFIYLIPRDRNRAEDGENLRYRFATREYPESDEVVIDILDRPCTVLEMMVALAIRCEECIMDDPRIGDRTSQWFWNMVVNLGLGSMNDSRFDLQKVDRAVERFLYRDYEPNGKGGLFTIRNCDRDLRAVEIWYQLCWYLDGIV